MRDPYHHFPQGSGNLMNDKYPEKNPNYSPSISYNYSPQAGYNGNSQMHPRRRNDRFRRESLNSNERVIRQNDIIIRLLKEIRDRLPEPHYSPRIEQQEPAEQATEAQGGSESWDKDETVRDSAPEKANESSDQDVKNVRMSGSDEETF
jgi:hypothetical protein